MYTFPTSSGIMPFPIQAVSLECPFPIQTTLGFTVFPKLNGKNLEIYKQWGGVGDEFLKIDNWGDDC